MSNKISLICFLIVNLAVTAIRAQGAQTPEVPHLTVSGKGEVRVAPDRATVELGVMHQASTAQKAQEEVNRAANQILQAIRQLGIPESQIQTTRLQISPVYAPHRGGPVDESRVIAYRASNVVRVVVTELRLVGEVIDASLKSGANQVEQIFFDLKDELPAQREALQMAVRRAREKAEAMAAALQVELVAVLEVNEGGGVVIPLRQRYSVMAESMAADATPVSPGELTISADVTIRYHIR